MKNVLKRVLPYTFTLFLILASVGVHAQPQNEGRGPIHIRSVPDSTVSRMRKQEDFRYANDPSYWIKQKPERSAVTQVLDFLSRSGLVKWILVLLLGSVFAFTLYQVLSVNGFNLFTIRKKRIKTDSLPSAAGSENIEALLAAAVHEQKFREATRYLYLKTLKGLHETKQISLQAKATNDDYLFQMSASPYVKDFAKLIRVFEYVWYGEFQPDEEQFRRIDSQFNLFIARI